MAELSGDVIDAIRPDLEAFASLWSALRTNYQGTNITKTVARLLHMYQPEDGVLAYERLLRTLYVLLEDFDGDGLRLLVSMVPPPKGVPDEIIKDVFHKATGFVRLNAPIFHRNNAATSDVDVNIASGSKNTDVTADSGVPMGNVGTPRLQTILSNAENLTEGTTILRAIVKSEVPTKNTKSPKLRQREGEVFRGFPSTEITNTQSHARNMTHFYGPTTNYGGYPQNQTYVDYHREVQSQSTSSIPPRGSDPSAYRLKWIDTPMLVRKNNYNVTSGYPDLILKTSDNKYIRLPITKLNGPPIGEFNSSYGAPVQTAYQTYYPNSQINLQNKDVNVDSGVGDSSMKLSRDICSKSRFDETIRVKDEDLANSRLTHTDHDYGFPMYDEVSTKKENFVVGNSGSPNYETMEKFRDTVKNSQRAIQEDIYRMDVVRCDDDNVETPNDEVNVINVENLTATEELKKGVQDFLKRAENEKSLKSNGFPKTRMLQDPTYYSLPQMESSSRIWKIDRSTKYREKSTKFEDSIHSFNEDSFRDSTSVDSNVVRGSRNRIGRNQTTQKSERTSQKMANHLRISGSKNFVQRSSFDANNDDAVSGLGNAEPIMESVVQGNETMQQTNSISDIMNYRKQYYDALISIQRAKVAVANSLAISSSQSPTNYDPRVYQYLQHQHQLLQRQQRILLGPQHPFNRRTMGQSGHANIRDDPGLWIRGSNDWKYSSYGQYAFPHQGYGIPSSSSCPPRTTIDPTGESSTSQKFFSQTSHHLNRTPRPTTKRRKLDDIVDELRDTDVDN